MTAPSRALTAGKLRQPGLAARRMTTDVDNTTAVELLPLVIADAGWAAQQGSELVSVRLLALAAILLPLAPVALIVTNPADVEAWHAGNNGPMWIGGGRRGA